MKKVLAFLLLAVMALTVFTSCGNTVYDDLENFVNVSMKKVNENYEKIKSELAMWEQLETEADLEASIKDVLLPLIEDSLKELDAIAPETDEVKDLKAKYVKVMEAYKDGFNDCLTGVQQLDEDMMLSGQDKISDGLVLLDEYNTALKTIADEVGAKVEY